VEEVFIRPFYLNCRLKKPKRRYLPERFVLPRSAFSKRRINKSAQFDKIRGLFVDFAANRAVILQLGSLGNP